jgi:hypothetical protein
MQTYRLPDVVTLSPVQPTAACVLPTASMHLVSLEEQVLCFVTIFRNETSSYDILACVPEWKRILYDKIQSRDLYLWFQQHKKRTLSKLIKEARTCALKFFTKLGLTQWLSSALQHCVF